MKTREELGIFFPTKEGHEEAHGICFYGYYGKMQLPKDVDSLAHFWERMEVDISTRVFETEDGMFLILRVRINQWPTDKKWREAVINTLIGMVQFGALVSWCGGELCSWSLVELDPATTGGCVYAAYSIDTGLILHSGLDDEIAYLTDAELSSLPR